MPSANRLRFRALCAFGPTARPRWSGTITRHAKRGCELDEVPNSWGTLAAVEHLGKLVYLHDL